MVRLGKEEVEDDSIVIPVGAAGFKARPTESASNTFSSPRSESSATKRRLQHGSGSLTQRPSKFLKGNSDTKDQVKALRKASQALSKVADAFDHGNDETDSDAEESP